MPVSSFVVVVDASPLEVLLDDIVHEAVGGGEAVTLCGVDRPAAEYSRAFGAEFAFGPEYTAGIVVALVNSRTLLRLVEGDTDEGIDLLRTALIKKTPTLLAVSDDSLATQLDPTQWAQVVAFLSTTGAKWLSIPDGTIGPAANASPPPAEFDLGRALDPPEWALPWSWE
ncbi:hypothetical protein ITJ66_16655 [Plantibacter sp. VKM Ac-2885]|uniref:hypothetical protein n=1 Tax=Plantibacter sp. VKM Ac-2885 TaxID=2783828 RepID=UPI00188D27D0|nr:hypothetical protein [Plantibacter sp. VKM Ac-2885]MBF4514118.1 hypothetical protein [Plantibacter sp. VKM Ac-2885]